MISNAEFLLHSSNGNRILNKDPSVLNDGNKHETRKYTQYSIIQLEVYMLVYKIHSVFMHTHECVRKANCKSSVHISYVANPTTYCKYFVVLNICKISNTMKKTILFLFKRN
jgi:hypothetical protein